MGAESVEWRWTHRELSSLEIVGQGRVSGYAPSWYHQLRWTLGDRFYVHCSGGVNRSPSTVVGYLHWVQGMELDEAVSYVRQRHSCNPYVESIRLAIEDRMRGGGG